MRVRNSFLRSGLTVAAVVGVVLAGIIARGIQANGVFSSVTPGFSGTCQSLAVPGVADIEIDTADHLALLAVRDARHPGPRDGIYALGLSGSPALTRLAGTPADFHPGGIATYRTPGGLLLMAVNHRSGGRSSIDTFLLTRKDGVLSLAAQGAIEGGLLRDPQDIAIVGQNNFYVSNGITGRNALMRALQRYGIMPGGDIVYFNGMSFREVVNGISGGSGLAVTADGGHVIAAALTGRSLVSLSRESFTGNLSQAGQLALPSGPDRITVEGNTLWVAGHANLLSWRGFGQDPAARISSQIFRVQLAGGVPQSAEQVYGNDGDEIAGAAVAAAAGERLLIGSPLDGKLLDCTMK
ncbi:MAG TPA: hypothetical protein VHV26_01585 [Rhizomicrobium sp.]|jgi:hypothetical protein|nr:hypothetical protein [Rhizomicrobium sp.]